MGRRPDSGPWGDRQRGAFFIASYVVGSYVVGSYFFGSYFFG